MKTQLLQGVDRFNIDAEQGIQFLNGKPTDQTTYHKIYI